MDFPSIFPGRLPIAPTASPAQIALSSVRASLDLEIGRLFPRVTRENLAALLEHVDNLEFEVSRLKGTTLLAYS